jgi:hypothetical protein
MLKWYRRVILFAGKPVGEPVQEGRPPGRIQKAKEPATRGRFHLPVDPAEHRIDAQREPNNAKLLARTWRMQMSYFFVDTRIPEGNLETQPCNALMLLKTLY